ncbi:MAG: hypothetical protein E6713_13730 [Sporomusaceae bacterium]|nr:hypothetical protein [Sporomusaceae bacterium]
MYNAVRHECGGNAHLVGNKMQQGWNQFCCDRCGAVFFRWMTEKMVTKNDASS